MKCDEAQPICHACQRANRSCEYARNVHPKDPEPEDVVELADPVGLNFDPNSIVPDAFAPVQEHTESIPNQEKVHRTQRQQQPSHPHQEQQQDLLLSESAYGLSPLTALSNPRPESERHHKHNSENISSPSTTAYGISSPHNVSNISATSDSSTHGVGDALAHWFDLLAGDARIEFEQHQENPPDLDQQLATTNGFDGSWHLWCSCKPQSELRGESLEIIRQSQNQPP